MSQRQSSRVCYHATCDVPYNENPRIAAGSRLVIGKNYNPFFGFYQYPRTYPVQTNEETIVQYSAIATLTAIQSGRINFPDAADIGLQIAKHYLMLARELIMEEMRLRIAPRAPSRKTCLWASQSEETARFWLQRLGGSGRILKLQVVGEWHAADASLLLADSEPLSETYAKAERYWRGETSTHPELELLIAGEVEVLAEI